LAQFKEEVEELQSIRNDVSNITKNIDNDKKSLSNSIDTISAKLHQARQAKGMEQEDDKESNLIVSSKKLVKNLNSIENELNNKRFEVLSNESSIVPKKKKDSNSFCEDKCPFNVNGSKIHACGVKDGNTCYCAPGR
jgi:HSP90 family molecular chaperone